MEYAKVNTSTGEIVAILHMLPPWCSGLQVSDLSDLTGAGMPGFGYFPIVDMVDPIDPATQKPGVPALTFRGTDVKRRTPAVPLSEEELAARAAEQEASLTKIMADAVQVMLDAKARERAYDGILSACTYATSSVAKFRAEGQACVEWRDAVWATCYTLLAEVKAGARPILTVDELLAELPALEWPA